MTENDLIAYLGSLAAVVKLTRIALAYRAAKRNARIKAAKDGVTTVK
jgi:hypothetical protein